MYKLPTLPYLRLRFELVADEKAVLPGYKGSMLRGAFGHALRRMVCVMGPQQACAECSLRRQCVFTRLFETLVEGPPPPMMRGLPTSPRPYIFEPITLAREIASNEPLRFDLLLLGRAVDLQAYAVLAVERMAAAGLGTARRRFRLERAAVQREDGSWEPGYSRRGGAGRWSLEARPLFTARSGETANAARLELLTPLRIKVDGELVQSVTFRQLAYQAVRRLLEVAHFHVEGAEIDWTFHPLLVAASAVEISRSELSWLDWDRYSNRQQAEMTFGGLVGSLELHGPLAPFWPLLRAAEVLHLGKGATFGLGRVRVTALESMAGRPSEEGTGEVRPTGDLEVEGSHPI